MVRALQERQRQRVNQFKLLALFTKKGALQCEVAPFFFYHRPLFGQLHYFAIGGVGQ